MHLRLSQVPIKNSGANLDIVLINISNKKMELSDEQYFSIKSEFLILFEDFVTQMIKNNCYCEQYLVLSHLFID